MIAPKRTEVLYSRITKENKLFIKRFTKKQDAKSEAELVNHIIDDYRKRNASNKKKSRPSN